MDRSGQPAPVEGSLSWRLSSHPVTLICFLIFRLGWALLRLPSLKLSCNLVQQNVSPFADPILAVTAALLTYLFGLIFTSNFVLIFIIVILLLSADFYYCKNIAGRRLVGLRWWNETNGQTGEQIWVFESADPSRIINATDSKFFWISMYAVPVLWVLLALMAILKFEFIWLSLVVIAVTLCATNTVAFSRCDKFSQAQSIAGRALLGGGFASNLAGSVVSRLWSRR